MHLAADPRVRPLFENAREAEAAYYRKNEIIPIMHLMVIRRAMVESYPELRQNSFSFFAKQKGFPETGRVRFPVSRWPGKISIWTKSGSFSVAATLGLWIRGESARAEKVSFLL